VVDCNNQGLRRPGEVLTLGLGAHTVKWMAVDIKGDQSAVKSQRIRRGRRRRRRT
jgi:hypothetical protein